MRTIEGLVELAPKAVEMPYEGETQDERRAHSAETNADQAERNRRVELYRIMAEGEIPLESPYLMSAGKIDIPLAESGGTT